MREPPGDLDPDTLRRGLADGWGVAARTMEYRAVGAGGHHWAVRERAAAWFVSVQPVDDPSFEQLGRAFGVAQVLRHDAGLEFVLAPVPAGNGAPLVRLTDGYALAVYPLVEGSSGAFGPHPAADRDAVLGLLDRLHRATPAVAGIAPRAELRLPGRRGLVAALAELDRPWRAGPLSEPARRLVAARAGLVERWLTDFDRLSAGVATDPADWVITHGEPHPGNFLRPRTGGTAPLLLIDWDTVALAPPERDLWMLSGAMLGADGGDADGMAWYRLRWVLTDVAAYVAELRRPHENGADIAASLEYLAGYLD